MMMSIMSWKESGGEAGSHPCLAQGSAQSPGEGRSGDVPQVSLGGLRTTPGRCDGFTGPERAGRSPVVGSTGVVAG